jgi:hypothetical protein
MLSLFVSSKFACNSVGISLGSPSRAPASQVKYMTWCNVPPHARPRRRPVKLQLSSSRSWLVSTVTTEQSAWVAFLEPWLISGLERQFLGSNVSGADYQVLSPLSDPPEPRMRPSTSPPPWAGTAAELPISCGEWKNAI